MARTPRTRRPTPARQRAAIDGARPILPKPERADYPRLTPDMSVAAAAHACVDAAFRHLLANVEPVLRSDDAEGIHQARVALRRLRSALALFRPAFADPDLATIAEHAKWLGAQLGPARDVDVFTDEMLAPALAGMAADPSLRDFTKVTAAQRAQRRAAARRALRARRFRQFTDATERWLARVVAPQRRAPDSKMPAGAPLRGIGRYAAERLAKRARAVAKRGRAFDEMDAESRHQLRLALKKLRYASEFFRGLYGKAADTYIDHMTRLQGLLGLLNDLATARRLASSLAKQSARPQEMAFAAGLVLGFHAPAGARAERRLRKAFRRFAGDRGFWS